MQARASLTEDGQFLIQSGMTAQGYFTDDMRWIPNSDLVGLVDGEPVEKIPSTLGEPQDLEAATAQQLLDLRLSAVCDADGTIRRCRPASRA